MTFEMITLNLMVNPSAWALPLRLKADKNPFLSTYGFQVLFLSFTVSFADREKIQQILDNTEASMKQLLDSKDE